MSAASQSAGAPPQGTTDWHAINWKKVYRNVRRLQARIVKAVREGRWQKVKALVYLLTHSFSGRAAAILAIVGFVNVPIIKFSVEWWNTLHQPASIFRMGGPTIDPSLLTPLFVMAAGFTLLFVLLHLIAMRAEILRRRVQALRQVHVERAASA